MKEFLKDYIKILIAVIIVACLRNILGFHNYSTGIDDSNIYFVYARNFYDGHGFVYNKGGTPVEGFTSLMWMLFLIAIYSIRFIPFELSILIACILITSGTITIYFRYIKEKYNTFLAWAVAAFILFTPGFIDWNIFSLLDLCLWIFSTSLALLLLLSGRSRKLFFVVVILLPFIRPEGLAVSFIFLFMRLVKEWGNGASIMQLIKKNYTLFAGILISIGALTLFRVLYFGYPLPNTFYAKVSMSLKDNVTEGVFYFYDALRRTSFVPFVLIAFTFYKLIRSFRISNFKMYVDAILISIIVLFFIVYPFLTGGDHFRYSRFFQPVFPIIALLFITVLYNKINWSSYYTKVFIMLGLVILNMNSLDEGSLRKNWKLAIRSYFSKLSPDFIKPSQLQSEFDIATYGRRLGNHLNKVFTGTDSLPAYGVVAAGGIAYTYKGQTIDLMGLNNPEMAHANAIKTGVKNHGSFNKNVFYSQNIDIFLSWPDPLTAQPKITDEEAFIFLNQLQDSTYFINRVCHNIFNDPAFNRIYSFCRISGKEGHFYGFIKRNEFIRKFPTARVEKMN